MIRICVDYDRSESAGASGLIQVISVFEIYDDGSKTDIKSRIDQGKHYSSGKQVMVDLGLDPEKFDCELE